MFRIYHRIAVMGLPLLVAGCSDDSSPPSGPRAEPPAAAKPALATTASRFQLRQLVASAGFSSLDPSGCVFTAVSVFAAEQTRKQADSLAAGARGKPATGLVTSVSGSQLNDCTGEVLRDFYGESVDATFQVDRSKLAEARLQATIPAFDFNRNAEVQVEVDVAWAGTGGLVSSSDHFRITQPGFLINASFKGASREAAASGTVMVEGENLAPNAADFAQITRAREGTLIVVRTREPGGPSVSR